MSVSRDELMAEPLCSLRRGRAEARCRRSGGLSGRTAGLEPFDRRRVHPSRVDPRRLPGAIKLANSIGAARRARRHHPDLHLESYRRLRVELTTHAIGGLSINDFRLAAKIDAIAPA